MASGLSKAGLAVEGSGSQAVSRSPQAETAQPTCARPAEDFLQEGPSNAVPSPCGFYPHTADPARLAPFPIKEPVRRAEHVFAFTREDHHLTPWLGDRAGEVLPVGRRPRRRVCERFAKGIRCVAQSPEAQITVEIQLMRL
jgi:hypothetical protein